MRFMPKPHQERFERRWTTCPQCGSTRHIRLVNEYQEPTGQRACGACGTTWNETPDTAP